MKDLNDLFQQFDDIQDLPVSEEIVGAYLDETISQEDNTVLENFMNVDSNLSDFVSSVSDLHNENIFSFEANEDEFLTEAQFDAVDNAEIELPDLSQTMTNVSSETEISSSLEIIQEDFQGKDILDIHKDSLLEQSEITIPDVEPFVENTEFEHNPPLDDSVNEDFDNIFETE